MATQPQYTAQPILEYATLSSTHVNTARDGSGTSSTFSLIASGPAVAQASGVGKRILRVSLVEVQAAVGAGTANVVRFFISTDNGTTKRLICEKAVPAVTSSTTAIGYRTEVPELVGLVLPGGTGASTISLYANLHTSANYHITVESGQL